VERFVAEEVVEGDADMAGPRTRPADELEREIAHLRQALDNRTLTSQATGILASQLSIETGTAWDMLSRLSNDTNIKLRDVARVVVERHDGVRRREDDDIARKISGALHLSLSRTLDAAAAHRMGRTPDES
jgi:hypothetical protein